MKALALLVALLCQAAVLPALGGKENAYIPAEIDPELMPRVGMAPFIAIPQRPLIQAEAQAVRILIGQTIAESGFFLVEPNEYTDELFSRDNIPVTEIYRPEYIEKLRMSALNFVIAGSLELISGHYLVTVRVLDLERRVFGAQASELLPAEGRELRRGLRRLIPRFVKQIDTGGYKVRYPENSSYNLEYEIGQTGPAGGIIFFKKATAKDGWRYLEVAPPSAEFLAPWGFHDHGFYGPDGLSTENGIGAGKVNTATIVAR
ncbi:MAG: hypothetical protein LBC72_04315, partial [Spirochaetaceae bacterium]|nr:hypothetical protein [Spirochaetaceae bacterium]